MLSGAKNFFVNMLSDIDGDISSKRTIGLLFSLAVLVTWASNLWYGMPIEKFIFDGLLYIIGIALATTAAEKFSKKTKIEENNGE